MGGEASELCWEASDLGLGCIAAGMGSIRAGLEGIRLAVGSLAAALGSIQAGLRGIRAGLGSIRTFEEWQVNEERQSVGWICDRVQHKLGTRCTRADKNWRVCCLADREAPFIFEHVFKG